MGSKALRRKWYLQLSYRPVNLSEVECQALHSQELWHGLKEHLSFVKARSTVWDVFL